MIAALAFASGLPAQGPTARPGWLGQGKFLVAGRDLRDPNFFHTVVLILEHSSEGALGVVVNRPTEVKLADLMPDLEGLEKLQDRVFEGGPVLPGHVMLLLRAESEPSESHQVIDGVFYSASREALSEVLGRGGDRDDVRIFLGHAGWAAGQLEWEVKGGGWHILSADSASVFDEEPAELWDHLIDRTSGALADRGPADRGPADSSLLALESP